MVLLLSLFLREKTQDEKNSNIKKKTRFIIVE